VANITLVHSQTSGAAAGANVTLTFQTPLLPGDVIYVVGGHFTRAASNIGPDTANGTYTQIALTTSTNMSFGAWRLVCGASPPTQVVCQGNGNAADACQYHAYIFRGVDNTTPEDVTATTSTGTSTNPTSPAITTVTDDAVILLSVGSTSTDAAITFPAGYQTSFQAVQSGTTNSIGQGTCSKVLVTHGTETPAAFGSWTTGTWAGVTVAIRPDSGTQKAFIFKDAAASGSTHGSLQELTGAWNADAVMVTGWKTGTVSTATPFEKMTYGSEVSAFVASTQLTPAALGTDDAFRTENQITATFAAGDWIIDFYVTAITTASTGTGRMRARIWKSANATGSGATELTTVPLVGTTATRDVTGRAFPRDTGCTRITWTPGTTIALSGEYLFVQLEWEIQSAGGTSTADHHWSTGSSSALFTPALVVTPQGAATLQGTGSFSTDTKHNKAALATLGGAGSLLIATQQTQRALATFAGAGSLTADTAKYKFAAATFAGSGALSANAQVVKFAEATFAGSGSLSADENLRQAGAAIFAGNGTLSADATVVTAAGAVHQGAATFAGVGLLSADENLRQAAAASFAGDSSLSVDTQKSKLAAATFAGLGTLPVFASLRVVAAASYAGVGSLQAYASANLQVTVTFTGDSTLSVTAVKGFTTHSGEATFAGAGALSVSAQVYKLAAATFAGAGSLSVDESLRQAAAVSYAGAGALSARGVLQFPAAATFGGAGTLSADESLRQTAAATYQGAGSLSAVVQGTLPAAATFAGAGSLSAFATITGAVNAWSGEARFAGAGNLSVDTLQRQQALATFAGAGALSVTAQTIKFGAVSFAGAGTLSVDASLGQTIAASFAGAGSLSVLAATVKFGNVTFSGAGTLSGDATVVAGGTVQFAAATFAGAGSLAIDADLQLGAAASFAGSGSLSVTARLAQQVAATFAGAGALSADESLRQAAAATFAGAGSLSATTSSQQQAAARFGGAGNLSATAEVAGTLFAFATFAGAGALSAYARGTNQAAASFAGTGQVSATLTAVMRAAVSFAGAGALVADVTKPAAQAVIIFGGSGTLSVATVASLAVNVRFAANSNFSADTQYRQAHPGLAVLGGAGALSANVLHFRAQQAQVRMDGAGGLSIATRQNQNVRAIFDGRGIIQVHLTSSSDLLPIIPVPVPGSGAQPRPGTSPATGRNHCAPDQATARDTRTTTPAVKRVA